MKRIINGIIVTLCLTAFFSCGGKETKKETTKPLNISIYLDLSDRIIKDMTPNQIYRDTAIINFLVDYFREQTLGPAILKSENKMKVFFYPAPSDAEISTLAQGLSVDVGSKEGVEKRKALDEMKSVFQKNLAHIYEETVRQQKWVGCDIWGFFSDKKVDDLCVRDGARNIIIILTDGYIYAENHKIKDGKSYSYISSKTLAVDGSSLIDKRNGELKGKGIEVLVLEITDKPDQRDKMKKVLKDWFSAMGIEKSDVAETDPNLTNTQTIIKNFLDN